MLVRCVLPLALLMAATAPLPAPTNPSFELSRDTNIANTNNVLNAVVTGDFNNDEKPDYIVADGACNTEGNSCEGTSYVNTTQSLKSGSHDLVFKLWDDQGNVYTAQKTVTVD